MTHWGGSIRPWCTYVYLSVTLGKDRHIHTVTLGKDRYIHIRIYACAHGHWQCQWVETALERRRRLARERKRVLHNISGWLREKAFGYLTMGVTNM